MAKKMGRPQKNIDQLQFEKLCSILCTLHDIAGFFDCSPDHILRWCKRTYDETFSDIFKKKSSGGRISLRRKQFEMAMAGDRVLLIWLGKQHLGQRDMPTDDSEDTKPIASVYKLYDANKPDPKAG